MNEMLDVHGDDLEDESIPMCHSLGLDAREPLIKAYGASCNRLPQEVGEKAEKAVEEAAKKLQM